MYDPKALIITADGFEDSELLVPMYRLQEAGFSVDVAAPAKGTVTGKQGYEVEANLSLDKIESAEGCGYKILVIPGGKAPAKLREIPKALDIARDFAAAGLPIAAICHGPQVLISAGLLRGRKATCYKTVREEMVAAGVDYQDVEVVVDGQFVTSRQPSDLPAFNHEIMRLLGV